jgi:hypothetical protein
MRQFMADCREEIKLRIDRPQRRAPFRTRTTKSKIEVPSTVERFGRGSPSPKWAVHPSVLAGPEIEFLARGRAPVGGNCAASGFEGKTR